jgi:hypothetical protein
MPDKFADDASERASTTLSGTVEKVIKPMHPSDPEKAQISVEGADDLYRELRIENNLKDEDGHKVPLKEGQTVDVTIEASAGGVQSSTRPGA